jgi:DNA-binding transcriptional ArsR family regulator
VAAPCARLDLAELDRRPLRVELSPAPTLFALVADAVGAHRGAPPEWLERVRAQLDRGDLVALSPLAVRPGVCTPARVMPRHCADESDLRHELDRIAELPAEALLDDIAFAYGPAPEGPWAVVARQPRRWLPRYADALRRAWGAVREPWLAAAELFDRELRRIGVAGARGAGAELVSGIHPRARVVDGKWLLPDPELTELRLPEDGLTLIPILGGPESQGAGLREDGTLDWIAYPLAEAWAGMEPRGRPSECLEALLGPQRALLLSALQVPRSVGKLAEALMAVPSAATHHVGALEAAGLVVRERAGRNVVVHRTARGAELVALYEED